MNKKYFYKYAISKQQQIQKESNHLFQVALLFFFLKDNYCCIPVYYIQLGTNMITLLRLLYISALARIEKLPQKTLT